MIDPQTFTDFLRRIFKDVLDSIAGFLNKLGIRPNVITTAGLIGNLAGAVMIAFGNLTWGGIIAMLAGPLDALDGVMARLRNESGRYGAFVDSVTDRYSEIVIYGGLLVYFSRSGTWEDALLVFFAVVGIAISLKTVFIVVFDDMFEKPPHRMPSKIRRHIADSDPACVTYEPVQLKSRADGKPLGPTLGVVAPQPMPFINRIIRFRHGVKKNQYIGKECIFRF